MISPRLRCTHRTCLCLGLLRNWPDGSTAVVVGHLTSSGLYVHRLRCLYGLTDTPQPRRFPGTSALALSPANAALLDRGKSWKSHQKRDTGSIPSQRGVESSGAECQRTLEPGHGSQQAQRQVVVGIAFEHNPILRSEKSVSPITVRRLDVSHHALVSQSQCP